MSDTEIVTVRRTERVKKDTKPEIAREKLKEKRERLKKEKEQLIIEEAKKRIIADEQAKKDAEEKAKAEEEAKINNDPMAIMMRRMDEMFAKFNAPKIDNASSSDVKDVGGLPKSTRKPRKKAEPEPEPTPKPRGRKAAEPKSPATPASLRAPKPRVRKQKVVYDSPSNVFVGSKKANIPMDETDTISHITDEPMMFEPKSSNMLLQHLMNRRGMNTADY
jgi:hypothetical protein